MPKANPTVKFFTLGCKANQYDTQSIRERFIGQGFQEATSDQPADYFLINTCTVTAGADQKSRQIIRRCIQAGPRAKVIVTGCLVEKDWRQLKMIKGIDLIIKKSFFPEGISGFSQHTRAFLKIQDGCNNFCTYCKVALVRGKPRSKKLKDLLQEAKGLVSRGYKEIVLTGICLGAYGKDLGAKTMLIDALRSLEAIDGLYRIRLSSMEPQDVNAELISYLSGSQKACRHLHIPIQSGDDYILKRMNRKYKSKDYENLIIKLKKKIPGICITTDCLIGFPGETDVNFNNTVNLVKKSMPLKVHIFPYSVRPLTKAAEFSDPVDPQEVSRRCARLAKVAGDCRKIIMQSYLGKIAQVLIEGGVRGNFAYSEGFSDNYLPVRLPFKPEINNRVVPVRLTGIWDGFLVGEHVDNL